MRDFISRRPLLFSVLLILAYDFGMQGLKFLIERLSGPSPSYLVVGLIVQGAFCAFIAALIAWLRWRRDAGFTSPVRGKALLAYAPWLILILIMAADIKASPVGAPTVLGFAAMMLMVGFAEEALLRGVVLRALLPGGTIRAAVLSSLIFGLAHLVNILEGRDAASTVVQAGYATFIGVGFAGPRLFSGTIWPAVAIHGLIDFVDAAGRRFAPANEAPPFSAPQAIIALTITGLYALYGLWLLRRLKKNRTAPPAADMPRE